MKKGFIVIVCILAVFILMMVPLISASSIQTEKTIEFKIPNEDPAIFSFLKDFILKIYEIRMNISEFFDNLYWNAYMHGGLGQIIFLLLYRYFGGRATLGLIFWETIFML